MRPLAISTSAGAPYVTSCARAYA